MRSCMQAEIRLPYWLGETCLPMEPASPPPGMPPKEPGAPPPGVGKKSALDRREAQRLHVEKSKENTSPRTKPDGVLSRQPSSRLIQAATGEPAVSKASAKTTPPVAASSIRYVVKAPLRGCWVVH